MTDQTTPPAALAAYLAEDGKLPEHEPSMEEFRQRLVALLGPNTGPFVGEAVQSWAKRAAYPLMDEVERLRRRDQMHRDINGELAAELTELRAAPVPAGTPGEVLDAAFSAFAVELVQHGEDPDLFEHHNCGLPNCSTPCPCAGQPWPSPAIRAAVTAAAGVLTAHHEAELAQVRAELEEARWVGFEEAVVHLAAYRSGMARAVETPEDRAVIDVVDGAIDVVSRILRERWSDDEGTAAQQLRDLLGGQEAAAEQRGREQADRDHRAWVRSMGAANPWLLQQGREQAAQAIEAKRARCAQNAENFPPTSRIAVYANSAVLGAYDNAAQIARGSAPTPGTFEEPDEPLPDVLAAFDAGEKVITARPTPRGQTVHIQPAPSGCPDDSVIETPPAPPGEPAGRLARIADLRALKPGWLDGAGAAVDSETLDAVESLIVGGFDGVGIFPRAGPSATGVGRPRAGRRHAARFTRGAGRAAPVTIQAANRV